MSGSLRRPPALPGGPAGGFLGPRPLAGPVRPMEAAAAPACDPVLEDPRYAFQVKWDGVRMLAFLEGGRVRLQGRRLRDRTAAYPELAGLGALVQAREAIVDGEVVVLAEGRPSFPRVLRREQAAGAQAGRLAAVLPATFAAFDLLYLDGRDLTGRSWSERQELLAERAKEEGRLLHRTRNYDDGRALLAAVSERGLEGVVAKARAGPYLPGRRGHGWVKVKVPRRIECVVGGYTVTPAAAPAALLLGLYREPAGAPAVGAPAAARQDGAGLSGEAAPALVYVGRVGSGLDEETRALLRQRLPALARPASPFVPPPRLPGLECRWLEPALTVVVAFLEWTEDLRLRAPSLVGFGRANPLACRL